MTPAQFDQLFYIFFILFFTIEIAYIVIYKHKHKELPGVLKELTEEIESLDMNRYFKLLLYTFALLGNIGIIMFIVITLPIYLFIGLVWLITLIVPFQ